jgi:hypothetical protein
MNKKRAGRSIEDRFPCKEEALGSNPSQSIKEVNYGRTYGDSGSHVRADEG